MNKKIIKKELLNFSAYMLIGITWDDCLKAETEGNKNYIIKKCASKAYLDMCRTVSFHPDIRNYTSKNKDKYDFGEGRDSFSENIINDRIIPSINSLIAISSEDYDGIFLSVCEGLVNYARNMTFKIYCNGRQKEEHYLIGKLRRDGSRDSEKFYFGQAQKWVNMTIKYMWLLGIWEEFDNIEDVLNVPVDNYVIEAVWHEGHEENNGKLVTKEQNWNIQIPYRYGDANDNRSKKFSTDLIKPWSKWERDEYYNFQRDLRKYIGNKNPMEWENSTWLAMAKKYS